MALFTEWIAAATEVVGNPPQPMVGLHIARFQINPVFSSQFDFSQVMGSLYFCQSPRAIYYLSSCASHN